jgi:two-component system phosphate regulon response regulator OmpR
VPREALLPPGRNHALRSVDVEINRLRRKIEPDPAAPRLIRTVRGRGYLLAARELAAPCAPRGEDS